MRFKGKAIGALAGLLILGPVGLLFGLLAGHLYDLGYFDVFIQIARGTSQYTASSQHRYSGQNQPPLQPTAYNKTAYDILGVSRSATAAEIKKAYRKLMSQNHPDKLIARGVSAEMIKQATQKTQRIKKAYEEIKKTKGW